jgi:hypothetical protein
MTTNPFLNENAGKRGNLDHVLGCPRIFEMGLHKCPDIKRYCTAKAVHRNERNNDDGATDHLL